MYTPFAELALLLIITAAAGALATRLHQPMLIAYIVIGIIVGPAVLGIVTAQDEVDLLAQIGVAILLFLVGLKLDLQHIRHIGPVALATGLGQLAFTIAVGFGLILLMGRDWLTALYVAVALTFSSTIIIVKLLSDKREIDSLHGRIAVGFLIVQDLAVVLAMIVMSSLRGADDAGLADVAFSLLWRVTLAALSIYVLMRYVLPKIAALMARSQELLLVFAIAWGTGLAAFGEWAGFSKEAGAFLAGFSLASTAYRDAINARLISIRDFLLLFFFIDLGAKLDFFTFGGEIWQAVVLSLFVLIGNPLIVMAIMGYMGYRKRTGFLAGLTVAQISEFSIIFVAMGVTLGHVGHDALGLTTLVGVVTIALSTYMILYSQSLYERLAPWLGPFERKRPYRELLVERQPRSAKGADIVVFGLGRYGARLLQRLHDSDVNVLGVDFDPERVRMLRHRKLKVRYGDVEDPTLLDTLPLDSAAYIVTALPDWADNRALLHAISAVGYRGEVLWVARSDEQEQLLRRAGVVRMINPFNDAADHAAEMLSREIQLMRKVP